MPFYTEKTKYVYGVSSVCYFKAPTPLKGAQPEERTFTREDTVLASDVGEAQIIVAEYLTGRSVHPEVKLLERSFEPDDAYPKIERVRFLEVRMVRLESGEALQTTISPE